MNLSGIAHNTLENRNSRVYSSFAQDMVYQGMAALFSDTASSEEEAETFVQVKTSTKDIYQSTREETGILKLKEKLENARNEDVPYAHMADKMDAGCIKYNGVTFTLNRDQNAICLGDMSNEDDVIKIPLSAGGSLWVNRNNIGELSKAIDMFSPEDIRRILEAISLDGKTQKLKNEIESEEDKVVQQASARLTEK